MKIRKTARFIPFIILFAFVIAEGQVVTNEQAVIEASRKCVEENLVSAISGFAVVKVAENEISHPVEIGLTEGFEKLGINVIGNDTASGDVQQIECNILGFDFKYKKGSSRGFLRKKMIKREFTAAIKLTFSNTRNRSVSRFEDLTLHYEDQLSPDLIDLVKSRNIPALDPSPPSSNLKQFVEPVVVTAAVGALIYLFFANR